MGWFPNSYRLGEKGRALPNSSMNLVQSFSSRAKLQHFQMQCEFITFSFGAPLIILFFLTQIFKKYRILEVSCIDCILLSVLHRYMNHQIYDPCVEIEGMSGTEKRTQILSF